MWAIGQGTNELANRWSMMVICTGLLMIWQIRIHSYISVFGLHGPFCGSLHILQLLYSMPQRSDLVNHWFPCWFSEILRPHLKVALVDVKASANGSQVTACAEIIQMIQRSNSIGNSMLNEFPIFLSQNNMEPHGFYWVFCYMIYILCEILQIV